MQNNVQNMNEKVNLRFPDEERFFTKAEMDFFSGHIENIVLFKSNDQMPYLNYDKAKSVFEEVVGNNYDIKIISTQYWSEFNTYEVHLRVIMRRRGKVVEKDIIGSETAKFKKDTKEVLNFDNLAKMAVKDAMKKFFLDYMGIGSKQYAEAKREYDMKMANKKGNNNYNNNYNNNGANANANSNAVYKCSDCGINIDEKVYNYSTGYHPRKIPLCINCQKKPV